MLGKVFDRLMQAAASKRLTLERLDEAVLRNLKFLDWLGLLGTDARVAPDRADELLRNEPDSRFLALAENVVLDLNARRGRRIGVEHQVAAVVIRPLRVSPSMTASPS